jgi:hypothetical protein
LCLLCKGDCYGSCSLLVIVKMVISISRVKCLEAGNTYKTLVRICQGKSSVENNVQMCLRETDCEVNSFDCPRKDTHLTTATG